MSFCSGTQQGVAYPVSDAAISKQGDTAAGDDPVANKDDEYAVGPFCRNDDDDSNAGNEWSGAWLHDNPVTGDFGNYVFELSRTLTTASTETDGQFTAGDTHEFGVAFWDPYEMEAEGWSDAGHYVSGCGVQWIELELVAAENVDVNVMGGAPSGALSVGYLYVSMTMIAIMAIWMM